MSTATKKVENTGRNSKGQFVKGATRIANSGRRPGQLNRSTEKLRGMIAGALRDAGGRQYLLSLANNKPDLFVRLIEKLLPPPVADNNVNIFQELGPAPNTRVIAFAAPGESRNPYSGRSYQEDLTRFENMLAAQNLTFNPSEAAARLGEIGAENTAINGSLREEVKK